MDPKFERLFQKIEQYVQLTDPERKAIQRVFRLRKLKKGQYLVHEGAIGRNQIFIVKGIAVTSYIDLEGSHHVIQFGVEGWWTGDLQSYVFQRPATCHVKVLEDSQVLEASYDDLQNLYNVVPKFERYYRILLENAYASFQQRMLNNLSMSAEDRYLAFLEKYPDVSARLPQKIIASYLGLSPEFFSRMKKNLYVKKK